MANLDLNEKDKTFVSDILGYLNFSSGVLDVQFLKAWNALFESFAAKGSVEIWHDILEVLDFELERLTAVGGAFRDSRQARSALALVREALVEYRKFHEDTLFHRDNSYLFNSFFMARVGRLATLEYAKSGSNAEARKLVLLLNDYIGYRPIPVFEDGVRREPNEHEWIAPLPLFYQGAGVAFGMYHDIVEGTLRILRDVDPDILFDACFDLNKLRELAIDPRAYDFTHPVSSRLNYSFGTWDDRSVDQDGYFRRFIVQRTTVDAIMARVWNEQNPELQKEYQYEASAILAGTILMGSGVSGGYVQAHDSSVSLSTLASKIANYRDAFYKELLEKVPQGLKARLDAEAAQLFQPFAGARLALNRQISHKGADQSQRFQLARTFARMGYLKAAERQADVIETTSARLLSKIDCLITESHLAIDVGKLHEAAACMPKIEELLQRALNCGAFPDPWYILGFDSEFNLFPSVENGVHDHRLDTLIDLLNDIFDLYSRLQKEASASGDNDLRWTLSDQMSELAGWWDQYGSTEVSSVEGFSGQEVWESAAKASTALAAWNQAGRAIGDVAFWKKHVERFKSPKAFVLLGEDLLERHDLISCSSLLIFWLSQSPTIPLIEGDYSFHTLAAGWLEQVWSRTSKGANSSLRNRNHSDLQEKWSIEEYLNRWNLTKGFLDRIEANADEYWSTPLLELSEESFDRKIDFKTDNPLLSDLARRVVLLTRLKRDEKSGKTTITVKASLRDAARVFNTSNLPSPEEFEKFYTENQNVFPPFISYYVFMEIIIGAVNMSSVKRRQFHEYVFGKPRRDFTISDPHFSPNDVSEGSSDGKRSEKEAIWENLVGTLGIEGDGVEVVEDVNRSLDGAPSADSFSPNTGSRDDTEIAFLSENDESDDDETITGGDPIFRAAYEHMSFKDSADDGNEDDVEPGSSPSHRGSDGSDYELTQETERVSERLLFLSSIVRLWKFAAVKSPLLNFHTAKSVDDDVITDARLRLEGWLKQAQIFQAGLYELLDQTGRFRVFKPSGTAESLVEYDMQRGAKEILLDRVISAIVEVEDVIWTLKATLRDETTEPYEKLWKTIALQAFGAIFRSDVKLVRRLWPSLLKNLKSETLLYIPTSRGGDAKAIVEARRLQQVVMRLLGYAPRLGLFKETFQLIDCVQKMEQNRLLSAGSITEYDKLVEGAVRNLTETLSESSSAWDLEGSGFSSTDEALVSLLDRTINVVLNNWLEHSRQIRISSVESITADHIWNSCRNFIERYGADLFTQSFLQFRNLRAILHQGAATYLASLIQMKRDDRELECGDALVSAILSKSLDFEEAANMLETILECVGENYSEYIDYNSTTTRSDHGENLYVLLDFLRVLSRYERISWNLKPVYWAHDALIRSRKTAAELWMENIKGQSSYHAAKILSAYDALNKRYGIWLQNIYERLHEQFVRPLEIAQMCALVFDAISEVRANGEDNPVFTQLESMIEAFASETSGVGYEPPAWLEELQDEVTYARVDVKEDQRLREPQDDPFEVPPFPIKRMRISDVESQLNEL